MEAHVRVQKFKANAGMFYARIIFSCFCIHIAVVALLLTKKVSAATTPEEGHEVELIQTVVWPPFPAGEGQGISIDSNFAYVAYGSGGLRIYDLNSPTNPVVVGAVDTPGTARRVSVLGSYAYVADRTGGLQIVDIREPRELRVIGAIELNLDVLDVKVTGNLAFVLGVGSAQNRLVVVDISSPAAPVILGRTVISADSSLVLNGGYVYALGGRSLSVVDVQDPTSPKVISETSLDPNGGPVQSVYGAALALRGELLYVAGSTLQVFDISNPLVPVKKWQAASDFGYAALSVSISDNLLVLGNGAVFNISTPDAPLAVTTQTFEFSQVAIGGSTAYAVVYTGVKTFSLSPGVPRFDLPSGSSAPDPGDLVNVALSADYALIGGSSGVYILNTENKLAPYRASFLPGAGDFSAVSFAVGKAYILKQSGCLPGFTGCLQAIDLSDLRAPVVLGQAPINNQSPLDFAINGDYAYVAQTGDLAVFDISDPRKPVFLQEVELQGAFSIALQRGYAFVVGRELLQVLGLSDPARPKLVASLPIRYEWGDDPRLIVNGDYGYIGGKSLQIIDLSDPLAPRFAGETLPPPRGPAQLVDSDVRPYAAKENHLYALSGTRLIALDISNPTVPTVAGSLELPDFGADLSVEGGTFAVALGRRGTVFGRILDLAPSAPRFEFPLQDISGHPGSRMTLRPQVRGAGPLGYQWYKNGQALTDSPNLLSARAADLSFPALNVFDSGEYSLVVSNALGAVTSAPVAVKISAPIQLQEVQSWPGIPADFMQGRFSDMIVRSNLAYTAGNGLQIFDLSVPAEPTWLGGVAIYFSTLLDLSDEYAYVVANSQQLHIVDVKDPHSPRKVGLYSINESIYGVVAIDRTVFLASSEALYALDVSHPGSPKLIGRLPTNVLTASYLSPEDRAMSYADGYLYVGGLHVFDARDPARLRKVGELTPRRRPMSSSLSGGYLLLGEGGGLEMVDVRNPAVPKSVLDISVDAGVASAAIRGKHLFIASTGDFTHELLAYDITDPASPVLVSRFDTRTMPVSMATFENYALIGTIEDFQVVDIANPLAPSRVATFARPPGVSGFWIYGDHGFAVDTKGDLQILDITNPAQLKRIGGLPRKAGGNPVSWNYQMQFAGQHAFLLNGDPPLQAIDLTDIAEPKVVWSSATTTDAYGNPWLYWGTALAGNYLLLSENGLRILDVSNPSAPKEVVRLEMSSGAIATTGTIAFVAYEDKITTLDLTIPSAPVTLGVIPSSGFISSVTVSGHLLFVGGSALRGIGGSLEIFDVSDPKSPTLLSSQSLDWGIEYMAPLGRYLVTSYGGFWLFGSSMNVLDVSVPTAPLLAGSSASLSLLRVAASGRYAYAADRDWGVRVFELVESAPLSARLGSKGFEVVWPSTPESRYQLQSSGQLSPAEWIDLGPPLQATSDVSALRPPADTTHPSQFYRLRVLE